MPFLTKGKTNWKYILIVVVLAAIVGGGILGYLRYFEREIISISQFPEIKKPEKVYSEERLPRFEDFPILEEFKNSPASPDFSSNPDALRFVTRITEGAEKGPNFAGHYTIIEWGCGTECQVGVIVNAETGTIYSNLPFSAFGRKFQIDSNLLVANPPEEIRSFYPYYPYDQKGKLPEWLYSEYYKWEGDQFVLIYEFKPEAETANWKTYRDEEYGFEIKYPSNWIIVYESPGKEVIAFADEKEAETQREKQAGEIRCLVEVGVYNNEKGLSLYDWAINKWGKPEKREAGKVSEVKIDDLEGIKYEFMSMGMETNILFSKDNKVIDIRTTFDGCDNLHILFNQMLSTFRFIEKVSIFINVGSFDLINKTFEGKTTPEGINIKILTTDSTKFYRTAAPGWEKEYFTFSEFHSLLKNWSGPPWPFTVEGVLEKEGVIKANEVYFIAQ